MYRPIPGRKKPDSPLCCSSADSSPFQVRQSRLGVSQGMMEDIGVGLRNRLNGLVLLLRCGISFGLEGYLRDPLSTPERPQKSHLVTCCTRPMESSYEPALEAMHVVWIDLAGRVLLGVRWAKNHIIAVDRQPQSVHNLPHGKGVAVFCDIKNHGCRLFASREGIEKGK